MVKIWLLVDVSSGWMFRILQRKLEREKDWGRKKRKEDGSRKKRNGSWLLLATGRLNGLCLLTLMWLHHYEAIEVFTLLWLHLDEAIEVLTLLPYLFRSSVNMPIYQTFSTINLEAVPSCLKLSFLIDWVNLSKR